MVISNNKIIVTCFYNLFFFDFLKSWCVNMNATPSSTTKLVIIKK